MNITRMTTSAPGQTLTPNEQSYKWYFGTPRPSFKPKPTMLTKDQQRARSRNWIRFKVIQDKPSNITIDMISNKVITEVEYKLLQDIDNLRARLKSTRIQFLEQYRRSCESVELPKPPEKKVALAEVIDELPF